MTNRKEFRYGMRARGFSIGCQPMEGFCKRADTDCKKYYDILLYNRKLTEKEMRDYQLDFIGEYISSRFINEEK